MAISICQCSNYESNKNHILKCPFNCIYICIYTRIITQKCSPVSISSLSKCLEVLEDHEPDFLDAFMADKVPEKVEQLICTQAAKYCDVEPEEDEDDNVDSSHIEL